MTQGTIEETFEYRISAVIKGILKNNHMRPQTPDELFCFLEQGGADEFANAIISGMISWDTEESWFSKLTGGL